MLSVEDILQPENVSYTDNVWTWAVAHMLHKGEDWQITTITDTAPIEIVFLSKGEPLTDYLISGNTLQDGTPTSEAPVDVIGCGVRTGNLFPLDATKLHVGRIEKDGTIGYNGGTITVGTNSVTYQADVAWRGFYTDFIQTNENNRLTFSPNNSSIMSWDCSCYDENGGFLGKATSQQMALSKTYIMLAGTKKIRISVTSSLTEYTITNPMLNLGSTALPYEPYGHKLPLTVNGTEYPIYLGQVPTTRRIRKLVLTGDEEWTSFEQSGISLYRCANSLPSKISGSPVDTMLCNVLRTVSSRGDCATTSNSISVYNNQNDSRPVVNVNPMTLSEWTTFIQQQYAAGTPVTVWYVLAEPETAVVNEPLHKIGDYADTVSMAQAGVTIPTVAGANTLTIDTAVQPSSVTIRGRIRPTL